MIRILRIFTPTPSLTGGIWPLVILAVLWALSPHGGRGQSLGDPRVASERTAEWYAARDRVREGVVLACRNNPGEARTNVDCAAAWQGQILAAEREARRNAGDLTPPSSPAYWRRRPLERTEYLQQCRNMTAEQRARVFCRAAGFSS